MKYEKLILDIAQSYYIMLCEVIIGIIDETLRLD